MLKTKDEKFKTWNSDIKEGLNELKEQNFNEVTVSFTKEGTHFCYNFKVEKIEEVTFKGNEILIVNRHLINQSKRADININQIKSITQDELDTGWWIDAGNISLNFKK